MNYDFLSDIKKFNDMYKLESNDSPVKASPGFDMLSRLDQFYSILSEEVDEGLVILEKMKGNETEGIAYFQNDDGTPASQRESELKLLTELSDWLGDIIVYCASEARRWGIPLEGVLKIIMDSNFSKMGADGKPMYDQRGKVMKGPGYWKPEAKIYDLLKVIK